MASKRCYLKNVGAEDEKGIKHDYDQIIHGKRYKIPLGGRIELNRREAIEVRGHYVQEDGKKVPVRLEIEEIDGQVEEQQPITVEPVKLFICHLCGKEFTKKNGLAIHLKTCKGGDNDTGDSTELGEDKI